MTTKIYMSILCLLMVTISSPAFSSKTFTKDKRRKYSDPFRPNKSLLPKSKVDQKSRSFSGRKSSAIKLKLSGVWGGAHNKFFGLMNVQSMPGGGISENINIKEGSIIRPGVRITSIQRENVELEITSRNRFGYLRSKKIRLEIGSESTVVP
jgi:hypothetical protein